MMKVRSLLAQLRANTSGVAMVEFAGAAPILMGVFLAGAELTNFTVTKMRISQIALHVADNASRVGSDSVLATKQVSETQINDLLIGANLQGGKLDLANRARITVSSLEPVVGDATKMRVHWQRCYGAKTYTSPYGAQGATNLTAYGKTGKQVTSVPSGGGVIYVEVAYTYRPLFSSRVAPATEIKDVAAMVVRDERDFSGGVNGSGLYNTEGVTASTC